MLKSLIVKNSAGRRVLHDFNGMGTIITIDITLATARNSLAITCIINPIPLTFLVFFLPIARVSNSSHDFPLHNESTRTSKTLIGNGHKLLYASRTFLAEGWQVSPGIGFLPRGFKALTLTPFFYLYAITVNTITAVPFNCNSLLGSEAS